MILRPYGVVLESGKLDLGLEIVVEEGRVVAVRPHTGIPEAFVVSTAFVNAHSHLEYRGLQDKVHAEGYWQWLREITRLKATQNAHDVRGDSMLAAQENRLSGIAFIGEHSDRPFAAEALAMAGLDGVIFQELITFLERENPVSKVQSVEKSAAGQKATHRGSVYVSPHAPFTVDESTLRTFASGDPFSIHVAESPVENEFFRMGSGPIADLYRQHGFSIEARGLSSVGYLHELGLVRKGAQFVHCCDVSEADIRLMAAAGVTVAHCPRSNTALQCPDAPVREMLDAGVIVGLGLDSAASSGPIDMFAEMRAALTVSEGRHTPLHADEVWRMATSQGAASLGRGDWKLEPGSQTPLIKLHISGAQSTEDLIVKGTPEAVEWVS